MFYVKIRSRHASHNALRKAILSPKKVVVRFGSTTEMPGYDIEINTVESVINSSNKLKMNKLFKANNINSPKIYTNLEINKIMRFPIVAKKIYSSRGRGLILIRDANEFNQFLNVTNVCNYYFQPFFNGADEFRIHILDDRCIVAFRKALKRDTPEEQKFFRNSKNCVFYNEANPEFRKPENWDEIVQECIKATKAVGLTLSGVDIRCKTKCKDRNGFKIVEVNSAPSLSENTADIYIKSLSELIMEKCKS